MGAVGCGLLTGVLSLGLPVWWPGVFGLLGLLAGPLPVAWGYFLARQVPPARRGRTVAVGALVANLFLAAFTLLASFAGALFMVLPVVVAAAGLWAALPLGSEPGLAEGAVPLRSALMGLWGLFIVLLYAVGGVLYGVVQPTYTGEPLMAVVGLLPYLGGVVGAGWLADRWGRRLVALLAPLLLGLAFPLFMLDTGRQAGLMVQTLLMGGFACADVAIWTVLADVASVGRVLPVLGNGLGTMVLAIGGGLVMTQALGALGPSVQSVSGALAAALLFVGSGVAGFLPETLGRSPGLAPVSVDELVARLATFGLTPREREIARYLLEGREWEEICARLCISRNTLKTHVRNIYQKTGAQHRHDLLWIALSTAKG